MLSNDQFTSDQTDVLTFSSFEKTPEDIFNFDSNLVDKFTHNEKSIMLSDLSHVTEPIFVINGMKVNCSQPNMRNIIFNKLYDEHAFTQPICESEMSCKVTVDDEREQKCSNDQIHKISVDDQTLLFAENQGYDILPSSKSSLSTVSNGQDSQELDRPEQCDRNRHLTGKDLLSFAKQIATGMVID